MIKIRLANWMKEIFSDGLLISVLGSFIAATVLGFSVYFLWGFIEKFETPKPKLQVESLQK